MIPKTVVGMDLGKHKSQIAVLNEDEKEPSTWRISNTPEEILGSLEGLERPIRVVMEACANWAYFYELIEGVVDEVQLAHPLKTKAIAEARIKTDKIDARILAQLGKADFVYKAYIPTRETRDLREILRHRAFLVRLRTRVKNRVHGYLTRLGVENPFTDLFGKKGMAWLEAVELREPYRKLVGQELKVMAAMNAEIKKTTEDIEEMAETDKRAELLLPMRGIGPYTAMLVVAEIGDVHRFPSPKKLVSYAGLCPSTYQTGQSSYHGHLTKQGSKWLRWSMVEAAQRYAQAPGRLGHFYRRLARKKGTKTARVAVARRLLMLVYTCLKKGEAFKEDLGPARSVMTLGQ